MNSLEPNVSQKFVIVQMTNGETVLRGDSKIEWHKDIVEKMLANGIEVDRILGGGWIKVDLDNEKVYVWGKSTKYGEFSFDVCKQLLKQSFDYVVINGVPLGEKF